ncbi:hypothetical protein FSP39_001245 [Pinctada imbricata]|uniref:Uncharacterized protein n=1 Tax=Pinctada imbricata TaxID=66713 RepID=A0AA88XPZ0_PINIB|nr:hypothetical protein FSP39_001245 [Pinctada imbricata]
MKSIPMLILCLVLMVGLTSSQDCDDNDYVNGCSTPIKSWVDEFTWACNRHDVCYFCGQKLGVTRKQCDVDFYWRMKGSCPKWSWRNPSNRASCLSTASSFYYGVRAGGGMPGFWNNDSPDWCFEPWVKKCL